MQRKIIFTSQQPTNKLCNEYPFSANKAPMQKKKWEIGSIALLLHNILKAI